MLTLGAVLLGTGCAPDRVQWMAQAASAQAHPPIWSTRSPYSARNGSYARNADGDSAQRPAPDARRSRLGVAETVEPPLSFFCSLNNRDCASDSTWFVVHHVNLVLRRTGQKLLAYRYQFID